jgi:ubiquinone/menaquinone biosynthesis C-methylase UbiE
LFIAGWEVGASGQAIGVDFTPRMLAKAGKNTAAYWESSGSATAVLR